MAGFVVLEKQQRHFVDMLKYLPAHIDHQFAGNPKYDYVLGIQKDSLDEIQTDQSQRNDGEHERIFFDEYSIKRLLNQWHGRSRNGSDNDRKENRQNHPGEVGPDILKQSFIYHK